MNDNNLIKFKTFGCKVNTYDTGLLEKQISQEGITQSNTSIFLFNSCAVTGEATKDLIKEIKKTRKENPQAKIVVTGCSAQVDGKSLDGLNEIDLVVANSHKGDLAKIINRHFEGDSQKVFRSNIFKKEDMGLGGGDVSFRTRSFLKIQDGCNSFCSFCIIPYARGKSQSLSVDYLTHKISELIMLGVQEVVLSGIHIGDYRDEETPGGPYVLEDLIEQVLRVTNIPRIRLGSLEPIELTDRLLNLYQDIRLCPHFHMSIQSANSKVLKDMRRKYTTNDVVSSLNKISKLIPNAFVGMDVITGFPGESQDEFEETFQVLSDSSWTRLHVFPYSERQGTRAALSEEVVPWQVRKERASRLNELSRERFSKSAINQVGLEKKVLLLKSSQGASGLSRDFWSVDILNADFVKPGQEVTVKVKGYKNTKFSLNPLQLTGDVIGGIL